MRDCVQLITIPDIQNIRFSVSCIDINTLSVAFGWLIDELRTKKTNAEKVLVFCRKKSHVKDLYETFHEVLGTHSYVLRNGDEPMDDRTRLFAMYHKKMHHLIKDVVEKEFCKVDGTVRVVFCTIAFGMGVDVKGAYMVVHLGPSSTIDSYIQECGRVGRTNERMSHAILLKYSGCTRSKNIEKAMKNYVNNTELCRRSLLMKPFLANGTILNDNELPPIAGHMCCDVCAKKCICLCSCAGKCECNMACNSELFYSPLEASSIMSDKATMNDKMQSCFDDTTNSLRHTMFNEEIVANVRDELLQYRARLANYIPEEQLLTGVDIATGFSKVLIEQIVSKIWKIESLDALKKMITFFNEEHALQSWFIISNVKERVPLNQETANNSEECELEWHSSSTPAHTSDEDCYDSDSSGICRPKIYIDISESDSDTD